MNNYYTDKILALEDVGHSQWNPKRFEDEYRQMCSQQYFFGGGKCWTVDKGVHGKSLKAGMIVLAKYNSTNFGVDLMKIHGLTDCINTYGEGYTTETLPFKSVKEALIKYGAKTLDELKEKQHLAIRASGLTDTYGHDSHLYVEDLAYSGPHDKMGPWYYIFENKWVRGSGAEPLSFTLVKEYTITEGEMEVKRGEVIKQTMTDSTFVNEHFMKVE